MVLSQRGQVILFTVNLLLIVLICLYLKVPYLISEGFGVATDVEANQNLAAARVISKGLLVERNDSMRVKVKLPQSVIHHIKTFVFFLGHPRSGHSIVASLMDSHPHMVISHEADLFTRLSSGALGTSKREIVNALWRNSRKSKMTGKRAESTGGKGYTLFVDGLYQGTYIDYIDVIGDKKAGTTTEMLAKYPDKWSYVYNELNSVTENWKVIHVIRNPYDNIATILLYLIARKNNFGDFKQSNQSHKIEYDTVKQKIGLYFSHYQAITDARKTYNLDIIEVHNKDLVSDPRGTLLKLCNDLGVICSDDYLEICSNKVFKTESRTRHMIEWTDEQLQIIQNNIEKYTSLRGYSYDSS